MFVSINNCISKCPCKKRCEKSCSKKNHSEENQKILSKKRKRCTSRRNLTKIFWMIAFLRSSIRSEKIEGIKRNEEKLSKRNSCEKAIFTETIGWPCVWILQRPKRYRRLRESKRNSKECLRSSSKVFKRTIF